MKALMSRHFYLLTIDVTITEHLSPSTRRSDDTKSNLRDALVTLHAELVVHFRPDPMLLASKVAELQHMPTHSGALTALRTAHTAARCDMPKTVNEFMTTLGSVFPRHVNVGAMILAASDVAGRDKYPDWENPLVIPHLVSACTQTDLDTAATHLLFAEASNARRSHSPAPPPRAGWIEPSRGRSPQRYDDQQRRQPSARRYEASPQRNAGRSPSSEPRSPQGNAAPRRPLRTDDDWDPRAQTASLTPSCNQIGVDPPAAPTALHLTRSKDGFFCAKIRVLGHVIGKDRAVLGAADGAPSSSTIPATASAPPAATVSAAAASTFTAPPPLAARHEPLLSEDDWDSSAETAMAAPSLSALFMPGHAVYDELFSDPPSPASECLTPAATLAATSWQPLEPKAAASSSLTAPAVSELAPTPVNAANARRGRPQMEPDDRIETITPVRLFDQLAEQPFQGPLRSAHVTFTMGQLLDAVANPDFVEAASSFRLALSTNADPTNAHASFMLALNTPTLASVSQSPSRAHPPPTQTLPVKGSGMRIHFELDPAPKPHTSEVWAAVDTGCNINVMTRAAWIKFKAAIRRNSSNCFQHYDSDKRGQKARTQPHLATLLPTKPTFKILRS